VKDKTVRKGTFTLEQVTAIGKTASGDWKGLILIGFYTGQRLGDCGQCPMGSDRFRIKNQKRLSLSKARLAVKSSCR
jgi:hypothetical protein